MPSRATRRTLPSDDRRQQILDAALWVFARSGFAAARLDDVAERARIAKGTIYLHFADKEALFTELVRSAALPMLNRVGELAEQPDLSLDNFLAALLALFRSEVLGTKRKEILRLIIAEGPHFPAIASFYYHEVVANGLGRIRSFLQRAVRNGEGRAALLAEHPQLLFAPMLVALVWEGLFERFEPLDVEGLFAAHRTILLGQTGAR
jgi:AcrR family transcriptional regulator